MAVAIFLGCLLITGVIAFLLGRAGRGWLVRAMTVIFGGVFIWAWAMGVKATGWDGIGYAIGAFLMALPGFLGSAIGGGLGHWRRRGQRGGGRDDGLA